jgi:hypothetical protein
MLIEISMITIAVVEGIIIANNDCFGYFLGHYPAAAVTSRQSNNRDKAAYVA